MSIEEVINVLERLENGAEACAIAPGEPEAERKKHERSVQALREAVALLKTNPEAQPNEPLTLEKLREMKGEPVWLKEGLKVGEWAIALGCEDLHYIYFTAWRGSMRFPIEDCGTVWLAYRRPPKEGTP